MLYDEVVRQVSQLLKQGICVGLFPEGTTTDGKQAGHFHSALIQPTIDAGARLCPIALRYLDDQGEPGSAVACTGDTTLVQSIWRFLRCRHHTALAVFTPTLNTSNENRRVLARAAQEAIAQRLQNVTSRKQELETVFAIPRNLFSTPSGSEKLISSASIFWQSLH